MKTVFPKDRPAVIAALCLSFTLPFLFVMATDLVWQVGKQLPGNVEDTAIALPSGLPLMLLVCCVWPVSFVLGRQWPLSVTANILSVLAFLLMYALTNELVRSFGLGRLFELYPEGEWTNLFPVRLALAVVLGFVASLVAARCARQRMGLAT